MFFSIFRNNEQRHLNAFSDILETNGFLKIRTKEPWNIWYDKDSVTFSNGDLVFVACFDYLERSIALILFKLEYDSKGQMTYPYVGSHTYLYDDKLYNFYASKKYNMNELYYYGEKSQIPVLILRQREFLREVLPKACVYLRER